MQPRRFFPANLRGLGFLLLPVTGRHLFAEGFSSICRSGFGRKSLVQQSTPPEEAPVLARLFELCHLDELGAITECEILSEDTLPGALGPEKAARLLSLPDSPDTKLLFGLPTESSSSPSAPESALREEFQRGDGLSDDTRGGGESGSEGSVVPPESEIIFTVADWKKCMEEDDCEIPQDVLLKVFGPDAEQRSVSDDAAASSTASGAPASASAAGAAGAASASVAGLMEPGKDLSAVVRAMMAEARIAKKQQEQEQGEGRPPLSSLLLPPVAKTATTAPPPLPSSSTPLFSPAELAAAADSGGTAPSTSTAAAASPADSSPDPQATDSGAFGPQTVYGAYHSHHPRSRFHVHFGAGRLGMGLVVPAISASGIPFAVVQRPKPRWQEVFAKSKDPDGRIDFNVDGVPVTRGVKLLSPGTESSSESGQGHDGPDSSLPAVMPPVSLVFGSGWEELGPIVERATTLSCSLGSAMLAVLAPLLSQLPEAPSADQEPVLFCCENDHAMVAKLKLKLAGRVHVVDCMVDRVCTGRTIKPGSVEVEAEPWRGSIVVLEPGLDTRVPFCASVVALPRSQNEAEYLSKRKFTLVNGMHTVMAFLTLIKKFQGTDREYVLLKYTQLGREEQRMVEAWRCARIAELLDEFSLEELLAREGVSTKEELWDRLLDFSDQVLVDRFSQLDDLVSRVLGGGVANRWLTRLKPTEKWLLDRHSGMQAREKKRRVLPDFVTDQEVRQNKADQEVAAFFKYAMQRGTSRSKLLQKGLAPLDPTDFEAVRACGAGNGVKAVEAAVAGAERTVQRRKQQKQTEAAAAAAAAAAVGGGGLEGNAANASAAAIANAVAATDAARAASEEAFASAAVVAGAAASAAETAVENGQNEFADAFVLERLQELVRTGRTFCKRELDKSHQEFVREQRKAGGKKFSPTAKKAFEEENERTTAAAAADAAASTAPKIQSPTLAAVKQAMAKELSLSSQAK